jgi:hypothetical protein
MIRDEKIKRQRYTDPASKIITKIAKEFAGEKRILIVELTRVTVEMVRL